jgi:hypothetical protein
MSIGTDPIVSKDDAASLREILDGWKKCRADYAKLVA